MDTNTISVFLSQNREKTKVFLKVMFDDCKPEIQDLRKENNDLRNENKELQNSIEFCHDQTNDLKRRIGELQSELSTSHDTDLSNQVMKLEDYTRKKKSPHKWYLIFLSMYLDDIKHPTWLCRVDYTVYFVFIA